MYDSARSVLNPTPDLLETQLIPESDFAGLYSRRTSKLMSIPQINLLAGLRMNDPYRLTDSAIQRMLLRQGCWTADSLFYSLIFGLGIGLLGRAPLWPLIGINALFTLFHLKALRHARHWKQNWQDFEVQVEADRLFVLRHGAVESTATRSEIRKISEIRGNGLWIHTAARGFSLPSQLSGYEKLKTTLATWTAIERTSSLPLWMYIGWPAAAAVFASALLVRSPYVFLPLLAFTGFYLLRLARVSIKTWKTDGWNWHGKIVSGRIQDPFWIPAIPFVMLGMLVVKSIWLVF